MLFLHVEDSLNASVRYAGQEALWSGPLREISKSLKGKRPVVLLPGNEVTLLDVRLPAKHRRQALSALGYLIEDRIAQPLAEVTVVPGEVHGGHVTAAVIANERLSYYLRALKEAGVRPRLVTSEVLALPWSARHWTWIEGADGMVRVRTGRQRGFVAEAPLAAEIVRRIWSGGEQPERIDLHTEVSDHWLDTQAPSGCVVDHRPWQPGLALDGPFAPIDLCASPSSAWSRPVRAAAVLWLAWAVVQAGVDLWGWQHPATAVAGSGGFLAAVRDHLDDLDRMGSDLTRLQYRDGRLTAWMKAPDKEALQRLRKQWEAPGRWVEATEERGQPMVRVRW